MQNLGRANFNLRVEKQNMSFVLLFQCVESWRPNSDHISLWQGSITRASDTQRRRVCVRERVRDNDCFCFARNPHTGVTSQKREKSLTSQREGWKVCVRESEMHRRLRKAAGKTSMNRESRVAEQTNETKLFAIVFLRKQSTLLTSCRDGTSLRTLIYYGAATERRFISHEIFSCIARRAAHE
jgi:hypothetical protein